MNGAYPTNAYCLFCRTGAELDVVRTISQNFPALTALAPVKVLPEKLNGVWRNREKPMLPGYVFVYSDDELPHDLRRKTHHLYKILDYERGIRALTGPDQEYATWLLRHEGKLAPSRVLAVGDQVQVLSGPLEDFGGRIVKLDNHKKRVWVEFEFDGAKRVISMGAESVDTAQTEKEEQAAS